jgi:FeS assembly protein IscX
VVWLKHAPLIIFANKYFLYYTIDPIFLSKYNPSGMSQSLYWDTIYEIVLALMSKYPNQDLQDVTLETIFGWVTGLSNFKDDPELANDEILLAIYQEWYEELNPI